MLKPYSITAEVTAPKRKYLSPASVDLSSAFMNPANMYSGIEVVSMAKNSMMMSAEEAINTIPSEVMSSSP